MLIHTNVFLQLVQIRNLPYICKLLLTKTVSSLSFSILSSYSIQYSTFWIFKYWERNSINNFLVSPPGDKFCWGHRSCKQFKPLLASHEIACKIGFIFCNKTFVEPKILRNRSQWLLFSLLSNIYVSKCHVLF